MTLGSHNAITRRAVGFDSVVVLPPQRYLPRLFIFQVNSCSIKIIIDVTGGQKTASIAAALVTLHSKLTFQYVQPHPPFQVFAYDVITESYFNLSE